MKPYYLRLLYIPLALVTAFNVYDDPFAFPQFQISWDSHEPIPHELADQMLLHAHSRSHSSRYTPIKRHNQQYLCEMPQLTPADSFPGANTNATAEEERKELALANQRGWELLKGMDGQCIYYTSGWWSYSFCYNQGVRQFHSIISSRQQLPNFPPIEDPSVNPYILGRYDSGGGHPENTNMEDVDSEAEFQRRRAGKNQANAKPGDLTRPGVPNAGKLEVKGQTRYLVQHLRGGTLCDLTGDERGIEVQFRCDDSHADRIAMVKETSICQYRMVIHTPRLCNDVAFHPLKAAEPHKIACRPVMDADAIPSFLQTLRAQRADEQQQQQQLLIEEAEREKEETALPPELLEEVDTIANELMQEMMGPNNLDSDFKAVLLALDKLKSVNQRASTAAAAAAAAAATAAHGDTHQPQHHRMIGNVAFGASALVPKHVTIEPGAIVGGSPKETSLAVVATSDGTSITKAELRRLHLPTSLLHALPEFKAHMQDVARGRDWEIVVVETRNGMELRGVVATGKGKGGGNNPAAGKENKEPGTPNGEAQTGGDDNDEAEKPAPPKDEL